MVKQFPFVCATSLAGKVGEQARGETIVGDRVGKAVGVAEGAAVVGISVGDADGAGVGDVDGAAVGDPVGLNVINSVDTCRTR